MPIIEHPTEWPEAAKSTLTRKVGPLPVWGWVAVAVGGVVAFVLVKRRSGTGGTAAVTNPVTSAVVGGFAGNYGGGGGTGGSGSGDTGTNPPSAGGVTTPPDATPIVGTGASNTGPDLASTPGQGLPAKLAALITPTTTDATGGGALTNAEQAALVSGKPIDFLAQSRQVGGMAPAYSDVQSTVAYQNLLYDRLRVLSNMYENKYTGASPLAGNANLGAAIQLTQQQIYNTVNGNPGINTPGIGSTIPYNQFIAGEGVYVNAGDKLKALLSGASPAGAPSSTLGTGVLIPGNTQYENSLNSGTATGVPVGGTSGKASPVTAGSSVTAAQLAAKVAAVRQAHPTATDSAVLATAKKDLGIA